MKIEITRGTVAGKKNRDPGDSLTEKDCPAGEMRYLVAIGKAKELADNGAEVSQKPKDLTSKSVKGK